MFRILRIQKSYVVYVKDAVTKAADLKVSLSKGLDVLDFLSPIYEKKNVCVWEEKKK